MTEQTSKPQHSSGFFSAPIWKSPFRPFYLFGIIYGFWLMAFWAFIIAGYVDFPVSRYSLPIWHGHEMVFGFSGAIIVGFVLTALPGWAETEEIRGGKLALLVTLWGAGRLAFYSGASLSPQAVLTLDSSLFLLTAIMVTPDLCRARNKHYIALIPILLLLCIGNIISHVGVIAEDMDMASWGIRIGIMAIVAKFILAGGFLTAVFTKNALKEKNGSELRILPWLEYLSAASLIGFMYGALMDVESVVAGGLALFCAAIQIMRAARWRTLQLFDAPLVLSMHLAYFWFVLSLLLFGAAALNDQIAPNLWLHVFTIGALSLMMLSLMTRVALRHTGHSLIPSKAMIWSFGAMFFCAVFRLGISLGILPGHWMSFVAAIWCVSLLIYILLHGMLMVKPSLSRDKNIPHRISEIR